MTTPFAVTPSAGGLKPSMSRLHPDGIGTLGDGYTYFENLELTLLCQLWGRRAAKVEVRGSFRRARVVTFGVQQLIEAERIDANTITGIVPAADAGSVDVIVSSVWLGCGRMPSPTSIR